MRSSIAFKIFCAATLALLVGFCAQFVVLQLFSNRLDGIFDSTLNRLDEDLITQNNAIFEDMERHLNEDTRTLLMDRGERQADAVAIFAIGPMQYGEIESFHNVCARLIDGGDYVALYSVDEDGSYFSGAARANAPAVVNRLGPEAANLRVDKLAEALEATGEGIYTFTSPVFDLAGVQRGEVRLLATDDALSAAEESMRETAKAMNTAMRKSIGQRMDQSRASMRAEWNGFRVNLVFATLFSLALAAVLLYITARVIARPLVAAAGMANAIRAGDLRARLSVTDKSEVGTLIKALNEMADTVATREGETKNALHRLGRVLRQVALASGEVTSSADYLANTSQDVANDAERQENLLRTIADSIFMLSQGVNKCADNATRANLLSTKVRDAAVKGDHEMERMTRAMEELNSAHANVAKALKVIDEIAFQTNLLALNAAVEAARAGRHGKGFAVVADEVRNLAAKSAKSATETEQLIQKSLDRLSYTSECVDATGVALQEIEDSVDDVAGLMQEIAGISVENASGLDQIKENVGQIKQVAERNHMSAASASGTAEELLAMAAGLRDMLSTGNGGTDAGAAPPLPAGRPGRRLPPPGRA